MVVTSWQGTAHLEYGFQNHQTQVLSSFSKAPFKIQRPFYPEAPEICHSVLVHTAGGMVGGDRLSIDLHLHPRTHALLTTSAAGKVYRCPENPCSQDISITVGADAICEWMPQETILFEGAKFQQEIEVKLEPNAIWMGMELFRYGRTARGERFASGSWRSRTAVWQQDRPLWIDRSMFGSEMKRLTTLGEATVMGTLVLVGREFEKEAIAQIRSSCLPKERCQLGITRLQQGILCRYLGQSTSEGRDYFIKIWESLRPIYAGHGICIPRVWQI